ncbi:MAG TPA: hypothetical protein VMU14_08895 [Acidimicrobiales bacterium]|nr:hypothetical protein [Acidimicrobiales bacterium]
MSAPTTVDQVALLLGFARRTLVEPRHDADGTREYTGQERRSPDRLAVLAREHDVLCIEACDPWEIAAGLEAAGVDDRRARTEFGVASVFDVAVELFRLVPRRPPLEPDPHDPWHRPLGHHLLRGLVNALPAVAYLAGLHLLGARAILAALLVPAVAAAGAAQMLSVLDHLLMARGERRAARRVVSMALGAAVGISGLWVAAAPYAGVDRAVAFTGGAQLVYVLAATALLVVGRDRLLLALLLPVVALGAALLLARGEAAVLHAWLLPTAGLTLAAAVGCAVVSHRGAGRAEGRDRVLELLSPGEVGLALECGGYGLAAAMLVAFPLLDALAGRPAPQLLPVALAPLIATAGVAEWLVHGLRGGALRALHVSTITSAFADTARAGLHRSVTLQFTAAFLAAVGALWLGVAFAPTLVDPRLALVTAACVVLSVVLVLTALMVSLGQQREAGLVVGVAVIWEVAVRPLLVPVAAPLLETMHVVVAAALLLATVLVVRRRYESPSAHR